ncbi:DNA translocase FtsK [Chloroflexia bacterium SDU3-3]|nr:DNA translocase FtsK [Chloroflexia bacterium SDU3-3]
MAKRTTTARKTTGSKARKAAPRARQNSLPPPPQIQLSPEHQREFFALFLITIAAITIVFYISGSSGMIGETWINTTQHLLGWGSLLVPLSLGLLGIAILWQERHEDLKFTGATIVGTLMVLAALLVLLEFTIGVRDQTPDPTVIDQQFRQGGGAAGFVLLDGTASLIGRPSAFILWCVVGLAGVMLTFNITLRELVVGMGESMARFWATVWGGAGMATVHTVADPMPKQLPQRQRALAGPPPFVPPPGAADEDEIVPTPIADRPTRASLFNRPEGTARPKPKDMPTPKEAQKARPGKKGAPVPVPTSYSESVLDELLSTPATPKGTPPAAAETVQEALDGFDVPAVHQAWPLPTFGMLETYPETTVSVDELKHKARLIEETLQSFKVEVQVVGVNTGPAVTQFELQPAVGVKVSKITTLEKDLQLALAASSLRIEAPIPGKNTIGIEIPNSQISMVSLREVMESSEFDRSKHKLKLPLGKDVSGSAVIAGMERMPHLLVAGATGSGKSVAVNSFVCALLLKHTPEDLKFIMVDPKMVELIVYNSIPHLLSPVVTELERVVPTLKWAVREMERRYKVFAKYGFRNLDSYRQAARKRADLEPMPFIVIIIDELADLMMMAPDEVETLICRLAQMARATGIHLIIATQRPSVDVVTGLIKANFPSRIAFAVTSQIDSRVILDSQGAEQLLGRGDALYLAVDGSKPVRVQGTFVSDSEVEKIVDFWRMAQPPKQEESDAGEKKADSAAGGAAAGLGEFLTVDEQDVLLPAAIKLVKQHTRASASLLQRRLRIGYSKAAQLIDLLEQQGIVGPPDDGRSREVLVRGDDA